MSQSGEIVINHLLCFLSSAKNDHSRESLLDMAYSFYSHEEIKLAKTELANILKRDAVWRRDPEKKRKDLDDVIEFLDELKASKFKTRFVSDNYKKIPPVGLEFIAPILTNLTGEVERLNELLPKILDIKSEVVNAADTVRQLRVDVDEIKLNFCQAVSGLNEASNDIMENDLEILNDIRSFRLSISERGDVPHCPSPGKNRKKKASSSGSAQQNKRSSDMNTHLHDATLIKSPLPHQETAVKEREGPSTPTYAEQANKNSKAASIVSSDSDQEDDNPWAVAGARRREKRQHRLMRRETEGKQRSARVTGSRKSHHQLKAVRRTADVFLGRMDSDVSIGSIKNYIQETFEIHVYNIEELKIVTDEYKAYKITVSLHEREKLFNPELWPEGIVVDKFYSRSKK